MDALEMLARLVDITEAESAAIVTGDAEMILRICEERATLLAALPADLPPAGEVHVRRFLDLADRNVAAAREARDAIGRQLTHIASGRAALAAYTSPRTPLTLERSG